MLEVPTFKCQHVPLNIVTGRNTGGPQVLHQLGLHSNTFKKYSDYIKEHTCLPFVYIKEKTNKQKLKVLFLFLRMCLSLLDVVSSNRLLLTQIKNKIAVAIVIVKTEKRGKQNKEKANQKPPLSYPPPTPSTTRPVHRPRYPPPTPATAHASHLLPCPPTVLSCCHSRSATVQIFRGS